MREMAVLADQYTSSLFASMGVDIYPVSDIPQAQDACLKLKNSEYKIVFLQEKWVSDLKDILEKGKEKLFPIFVFIPDYSGTLGLSESNITEALVRALGTTNI